MVTSILLNGYTHKAVIIVLLGIWNYAFKIVSLTENDAVILLQWLCSLGDV